MRAALDMRVTQTAFAEFIGVDQSLISRLISDGWLVETGTALEWLHQYVHRLREQAAGRMGDSPDGLDPAQESAALKRAQREGQEIKNAVLRGEYASISLLAEVVATASQSVSERFEQIPGILRKTCPDMTEDMRDRLMTVLSDARNEWVRATAELVARQLDADDMDGDA
jgi:phage terminase Nu1 subunit (DNA packaging protein)